MVTPTDIQKHDAAAKHTDAIGRYLAIYVCILLLATAQFFIAYSHLDAQQMFVRMLFVAIAEAGLAVMFFMHLWAERRGFLLFVLVFTIFVTLAMQYGWTDSYRMEMGAPYSKAATGTGQ